MTIITALEDRADSLRRLCELREAAWRDTPRWRPLLRRGRELAWIAAAEESSRIERLLIRELESRASAIQAINEIRGLHR